MNLSQARSNKTTASIDMSNREDNDVHEEESSITSSMTMESLAQRQHQTASRLDNIDAMLSQILGTLKSGQVSSHTDPLLSETGSIEGSGNNT